MLATKPTYTVRGALGTNLGFSFMAVIFSGMILDGGQIASVCNIGITMFWTSMLILWIMRRKRSKNATKSEIILLHMAIPIFILMVFCLNAIMAKLNLEPLG